MRFGSVCSGIEAASVAWGPLGWKAAWLAEIEPFPSAVLKHHYPNVPNLGDMTALPSRILAGEVEAPDLFCGGTPCQAFSVAGLRKSLDDARGNLSLTFCEIANAIDLVRLGDGDEPCIVFWENVPGVLNTKDNAFGCFLAGLAGESLPLLPPGGRWTDAGCVLGPQRAVAWRVLDAQYFGLAQRRKRVFVVASARAGFDPAAVLFEFDGVRRDTAPSRQAREGIASSVASGAPKRSHWDGDFPHPTLNQSHNIGGVGQSNQELFSQRGAYLAPAQPMAYAIQGSMIGRNDDAGPQGDGVNEDVCFTQNTIDRHAVAYAVRTANTSANGHGVAEQVTHTLDRAQGQAVAFHPTQDPINSTEVCHSLSANDNATAAVAQAIGWDEELNASEEQSGTLLRGGQGGRHDGVMTPSMQVRRLTPVECERLQGFPDGYTAIPWRGKPASECPDGPRYKALGNSWAVPVVRWIGKRISEAA